MRRLLLMLQLVLSGAACVVWAVFALSRLATDRTHVTQYLFWTPSLAYVAVGTVLIIAASVVIALRRPFDRRWQRAQEIRSYGAESGATPRGPRRRLGWASRLQVVAVAGVVAVAINIAVFEWRVYRFLTSSPTNPSPSLVVTHWNMTYAVPYWWDKYIAAVPKDPVPDVVIITNPTYKNDLPQLASALGPDYTSKRCGVFAVFTRLPVIETGVASLEIPPYKGRIPEGFGLAEEKNRGGTTTDFLPEWSPIPRTGSTVYDPGTVMFVRLDATATLGREIVIWGIDLPSEPRAWRYGSARSAAARLDALRQEDPQKRHGAPRFPEPDIILGDFNTPRGSASLGLVSLEFANAYDQAGRGYSATWPRARPIFHLDHIFLAPWLRASSYRVADTGLSEHLAQTARITVKDGGRTGR